MTTIDTLSTLARQTPPLAHPLDLTAKQIGVAVMRLVGRIALRVVRSIYAWQERNSQRRAGRDLDARMLADLGLSRADIDNAYGPPTWFKR